jgi:acetyl esterase/lipase
VRFLRGHAADLGIDPGRIGAWGSSAGGTLVSLLALAPDPSGQRYNVRGVVDMFGPSDLSHLNDSSAFAHTVARLAIGDDQATRRALSPIEFVTGSAPPFLILHGRQDRDMPIRHSLNFAARLRQVGAQVTFLPVDGTGHTLATPGERPSADDLTVMVTDFLVRTLTAR